MEQKNYPPAFLAWLVWGLGAAFYFTNFFHRVAPAVMTDPLMAEFGIGARDLGQFSAFYFYSYVFIQIPTGILADHWGPRKLLTAGSLVAALGTFLFASASSIATADLGRLLIGAAVGVVFVALLRLSTRWFPLRFYATMSGITLFVGVAGAVFAGIPLYFFVEGFGWRPVMVVVAGLHLVIGASIWWIVRDDPAQRDYRSYAPADPHVLSSPKALLDGLIRVLRYRNTWLLSLLTGGLAGPIMAFAGLWGVPFLVTHYGLPTAVGAAFASTMLICFAVGGVLLGSLSDRIGLRKPFLVFGSAISLLCWIPVLFVPNLPLWLLTVFVIAIGLAGGAVIVSFACVKESVPGALAGTVSGVCNVGSMGGGMILQPLVGWMLDLQWRGTLVGGIRTYDLAAYRSGFVLLAVFVVLAILAALFTAETRCLQAADTGKIANIP
ncbi:MAG: MFS transporter [Pseudomonadota bacterium]